MARSENTDVKMSSFKHSKGSKGMKRGTTDMGIPPFTQKPKNVEKLSAIAKTHKGKMKGSDKYC